MVGCFRFEVMMIITRLGHVLKKVCSHSNPLARLNSRPHTSFPKYRQCENQSFPQNSTPPPNFNRNTLSAKIVTPSPDNWSEGSGLSPGNAATVAPDPGGHPGQRHSDGPCWAVCWHSFTRYCRKARHRLVFLRFNFYISNITLGTK